MAGIISATINMKTVRESRTVMPGGRHETPGSGGLHGGRRKNERQYISTVCVTVYLVCCACFPSIIIGLSGTPRMASPHPFSFSVSLLTASALEVCHGAIVRKPLKEQVEVQNMPDIYSTSCKHTFCSVPHRILPRLRSSPRLIFSPELAGSRNTSRVMEERSTQGTSRLSA